MKAFKDYDKAKAMAQYVPGKLPEGAYVCKIFEVNYTTSPDSSQSDRIDILFDIEEGEYKDFFKKQNKANPSEDKKWKGKTMIYVPMDDGSDRDEWTKKSFAKWTDSIEKSNKGYLWDWDEKKWVGKLVGIVFGTTGTVIDNKDITYTEARFPVDAETVRSGKAPKAKFKSKNGYGNAQRPDPMTDENGFMVVPDTDNEFMPF